MASRKKKGKTTQTMEHFAHHEAGHYVAAYFSARHGRITGVTIVPSGSTAGENMGDGSFPLDDDCSRREVEQLIVELYAGHAAEIRFDHARPAGARSTASDDDAKASEFLGWLGKTEEQRAKVERRLRSEAHSLIEDHWSAVTALARELLERGLLEGFEAACIVAIAEGEEAARGLAEYRKRVPVGAKDGGR